MQTTNADKLISMFKRVKKKAVAKPQQQVVTNEKGIKYS